MNDMKVHVLASGDQFYPDIVVTCDSRDLTADLEMHYPKLLIEVLSPSTATFDRGDKFLSYRLLECLQEYVLIDPHAKATEVFRRQANGRDWLLTTHTHAEGLSLHAIDLAISGAALFENV
jgi:Uma2 family endonuclease